MGEKDRRRIWWIASERFSLVVREGSPKACCAVCWADRLFRAGNPLNEGRGRGNGEREYERDFLRFPGQRQHRLEYLRPANGNFDGGDGCLVNFCPCALRPLEGGRSSV